MARTGPRAGRARDAVCCCVSRNSWYDPKKLGGDGGVGCGECADRGMQERSVVASVDAAINEITALDLHRCRIGSSAVSAGRSRNIPA